ncbi:MAG: prephenate dehydrogenase/arogenate dehydrogenase family protein [Methylophilaceae bacterium]|nr:prephenate dehydrogenase/arogenate dehydrogenase family protein [Methylophilaceae bacterium]
MVHGKSLQINQHDTIPAFNKDKNPMKNILIFGVGLIGGSIALKSKHIKLFKQVVGVERKDGTTLSPFVKSGMLDHISINLENDIANADLIVVATPVAKIYGILKNIYPHLKTNTVITDVGSTKSNVMNDAKSALNEKSSQFIGSHPIAGSEKHGPSAAIQDLFEGMNIIVTPPTDSTDFMKEKINQFWSAMGGEITVMTPQEHDKIFSTVSHLPHILAFSLVNLINNNKKKEILLNFAASGFRDFSRIAASSPEVWRDISIANKNAILNDLKLYQNELTKITDLINNEDQEGLKNYFANASSTRQSWVGKKIE